MALLCPQFDIEPVLLRIFNVYGPRQACSQDVGVLTLFIHRLLHGEPCTILGDGAHCRDYVHVKDIAEAARRAADAPDAPSAPINIGSGQGVTTNELANLLQRVLNRGEFVRAPAVPGEIAYSVADIRRARDVLGYQPRYHLQDELPALVETIASAISPARP